MLIQGNWAERGCRFIQAKLNEIKLESDWQLEDLSPKFTLLSAQFWSHKVLVFSPATVAATLVSLLFCAGGHM